MVAVAEIAVQPRPLRRKAALAAAKALVVVAVKVVAKVAAVKAAAAVATSDLLTSFLPLKARISHWESGPTFLPKNLDRRTFLMFLRHFALEKI